MAPAGPDGSATGTPFLLAWVSDVADKMRDVLRSRQLFQTSEPERYAIGSFFNDSDGNRYRITRHHHLGVVNLGITSAPLTAIYGLAEDTDAHPQ